VLRKGGSGFAQVISLTYMLCVTVLPHEAGSCSSNRLIGSAFCKIVL